MVVVESGDHKVTIAVGEQPAKPPERDKEKEPLKRIENPDPPFGVRLLHEDSVVAEHPGGGIKLNSPENAADLNSWIERQSMLADRLDIDVDAANVTAEELKPLLEVGSRHGLAIDLNLRRDG
ncbi:MAG TPA: hypothetical protein VIM28_00530 [Solirubrobacterales bacterium]